ncbi:Hypothetical_protein [Hexamita inflata]|uniref:Hypothetical_protein n=1 Tax=Hexamita inflata TaxID=28002 RepID=A0AA86NPZ2_9EUKA|nr:Hypothetical protein HINF_LOCUS10791 [Hexamita inflata]
MESSNSFVLLNDDVCDSISLQTAVEITSVTFPTEQLEKNWELIENTSMWCITSWLSFICLLTSITGLYAVINSINEEHTDYQCLLLIIFLLMFIFSSIGAFMSVSTCYSVKSISTICFKSKYAK